MRVISLGWGVQSWALAAMSALGKLPPVDAAIHSDTTHEKAKTYAFAAKWTPWLEARGVRVVTVTHDEPIINRWNNPNIPAHACYDTDVLMASGEYDEHGEMFVPDGKFRVAHAAGDPSGMMRRQCTRYWKIRPIQRWLQANRNGATVDQWIGITLDEVQRMRSSRVKYQILRYPFIEYLDRPWTRTMVKQWLQSKGLEIPVKSSCVFCPYHDRATWREIKLAGNGDWEKALEVDRAIRDKRPGCRCYLTAARIPLDEVDFRSQEDHGQLTLWDEECSGMCFL